MKRSSLILSLCAGLSLLAVGFLLLRPMASLPTAPLRGLPESVQGFARVRLARVLASKAWREIVVERGEARGIERVTKACGFNPLEGLDEVLVAALPRGTERDVVVSARGTLDHTKLIACVGTYSGGSMSSYVHERVAGFETVRNKKGTQRAAFVGRDGLVAGAAAGVSATLHTLSDESKSAAHDPLLQELYEALADDSDIAFVARVPSDPKQRALLADALPLPTSFPLSEVRALTADMHLVGDRIRGDLRLWTRSPAQASALANSISDVRAKILTLPGLGLVGFAAPLRELRIEHAGKDVKIHGEVKASVVNAAIDLLPALAAMQRGFGGAAPVAVEARGSAREQNVEARGSARERSNSTADAGTLPLTDAAER